MGCKWGSIISIIRKEQGVSYCFAYFEVSVIIIFINNIGGWYSLYILYLLSPFAPIMLLVLNLFLPVITCLLCLGRCWGGVYIFVSFYLCFNFVLSSFLKILMVFSWSTVLCCFLPCSKVSQLYIYPFFFWFLLSCPSVKCDSYRHYIARSYF